MPLILSSVGKKVDHTTPLLHKFHWKALHACIKLQECITVLLLSSLPCLSILVWATDTTQICLLSLLVLLFVPYIRWEKFSIHVSCMFDCQFIYSISCAVHFSSNLLGERGFTSSLIIIVNNDVTQKINLVFHEDDCL